MEGEAAIKENHSQGHIIGIEIAKETRTVYVGVNAGSKKGTIVELDASSAHQNIEYWLPGVEKSIQGKLNKCALKGSKRNAIEFIKKTKRDKNGASAMLKSLDEALRKQINPNFAFLLGNLGGRTVEPAHGKQKKKRKHIQVHK